MISKKELAERLKTLQEILLEPLMVLDSTKESLEDLVEKMVQIELINAHTAMLFYNEIRGMENPAVAKALSDHFGSIIKLLEVEE